MFHHYLLVFAMFIYLFLASSHQLYAELWLDFLSLAGFFVTHEMTSRAAGPVPDTDLAATGYLQPLRSTHLPGWAFFFIAFIVFSSLLGCIVVADVLVKMTIFSIISGHVYTL